MYGKRHPNQGTRRVYLTQTDKGKFDDKNSGSAKQKEEHGGDVKKVNLSKNNLIRNKDEPGKDYVRGGSEDPST